MHAIFKFTAYTDLKVHTLSHCFLSISYPSAIVKPTAAPHIHMHVHVHIHMRMYMYIYTCACTCTYTHAHVHVHIHMRMHISTYIVPTRASVSNSEPTGINNNDSNSIQ